ncbi:hypothetical protein MAHJHV55_54340 [Mycobacterium avium subsp. hominissuis]
MPVTAILGYARVSTIGQDRRHRHTVSQPAAHQIRDTPARDKKRDSPRQRKLRRFFCVIFRGKWR